MKEKPILFKTEMVRAIPDGRKTQTRRVVKKQPPTWAKYPQQVDDGWEWVDRNVDADDLRHWPGYYIQVKCPYGSIGDGLWVKENWRTLIEYNHLPPRDIPKSAPIEYEAADKCVLSGKTRPNIFMCRWMSRFLLEITDIRVERVQEISEEDAIAEGIRYQADSGVFIGTEGPSPTPGMKCITPWPTAKEAFMDLWDSINGNWKANPWVWVVCFKVIK